MGLLQSFILLHHYIYKQITCLFPLQMKPSDEFDKALSPDTTTKARPTPPPPMRKKVETQLTIPETLASAAAVRKTCFILVFILKLAQLAHYRVTCFIIRFRLRPSATNSTPCYTIGKPVLLVASLVYPTLLFFLLWAVCFRRR